MPKHYKQNKKDRKDESKGMKRRLDDTQKYHEGSGYYGAGHLDFANLPTEVKQMAYPVPYSGLETDYPDTIQEIDRDLVDSYKKTAHYPSDSMY